MPRLKEVCIIIFKKSIHQKEIAVINMYAPKNLASKSIKQKLTEKGEIDKSTITVVNVSTPDK